MAWAVFVQTKGLARLPSHLLILYQKGTFVRRHLSQIRIKSWLTAQGRGPAEGPLTRVDRQNGIYVLTSPSPAAGATASDTENTKCDNSPTEVTCRDCSPGKPDNYHLGAK